VHGVEFDQKLDNVGKDVVLCSDRILFALESDQIMAPSPSLLGKILAM